jgi:hypothetical protein
LHQCFWHEAILSLALDLRAAQGGFSIGYWGGIRRNGT